MANRDVSSSSDELTPQERERVLVARFQRRLGYVFNNFRFWRRTMAGRRTFNESIADLRRAQRPRSPPANRARLHPEIEFAFGWKLLKQGIDEPQSEDVVQICKKLSTLLKPRRGRPRDRILQHHVEALGVLYEETLGEPLLQARTLNSVYNPVLKCQFGKLMLAEIQTVDSTITETAVVNILRAMPRSGSPERKRFRQYFPFADMVGETAVEPPGFELNHVVPIWPIYCS